MEKIIIEERQQKALRQMLLRLFMLLISLLVLIMGMKQNRILYWVLGFLFTTFFIIGFIIWYKRVQKKKPLITITFDGIIDSTTPSVGYISFRDIKEFRIVKIHEEEVIGIIPKHEEKFIGKLSPLRQLNARDNLNTGYPPFVIDVKRAKDMSLYDIYTLLMKRLMDFNSLYD